MTKEEKKVIEALRKELIPMTERLAAVVARVSTEKHEAEQNYIRSKAGDPAALPYRQTPKGKEKYKELGRLLDSQKHMELSLEKLLAAVPEE